MSKDYIRQNEGDYPVYSSQTENNGELGKINTFAYDGEYLTWTTDGANAGTVFYRKGRFSITNVCGLINIKFKQLLPRYLFYALQTATKPYVNKGMGNAKLMSNVMETVKFKIPVIDKQIEIINILDKFDEYCNDLTKGLPAEIEARQKQYEYYRNKLLTFN